MNVVPHGVHFFITRKRKNDTFAFENKFGSTPRPYNLSTFTTLSLMRIGLLSDTHSHLDEAVFKYFEECDEIWHAGDIGDIAVADTLEAFKPFRAVYGNIDNAEVRRAFPLDLHFECAGVQVYMTHIGGYPGRYKPRVREIIQDVRPKLFICGHSHILKIMPDKRHNLLHVNPGAAGNHGFHQVKTMVRFTLDAGDIKDMEVIETGRRGEITADI